jgi:type IV conjugative transfer system lipoprotein TraV
MKQFLKFAATLPILGALSGCATDPPYNCPLQEVEEGIEMPCTSMHSVYSRARAMEGTIPARDSIMDPSLDPNAQPPEKSMSRRERRRMEKEMKKNPPPPRPNAQLSMYPEPGQVGMPVFKQPRVHRVWVAPYVDADGNLRSGEYAYFSTPGEWNYGSLRQQGSGASGTMFGPLRPEDLGFNPDLGPTSQGAKPPMPSGTSRSSSASNIPEQDGDITQPAQRLGD